jgi:hypothetical protein
VFWIAVVPLWASVQSRVDLKGKKKKKNQNKNIQSPEK